MTAIEGTAAGSSASKLALVESEQTKLMTVNWRICTSVLGSSRRNPTSGDRFLSPNSLADIKILDMIS